MAACGKRCLRTALQGSKALTGCRDNLITFQQLDAGTLRGRSDAAAEIVLTRR